MNWKDRRIRISIRNILIALAGLASATSALADQEASNVAHVVTDTYGRCYAKSVPEHLYDPEDEPRQQGSTGVYQVGEAKDVLVQQYDWFSQGLFVRCRLGSDTIVVRLGPWQRGHNPSADHLAIAFYQGGSLLRRYSTWDIAGGEKAKAGAFPEYKNVSASVSHYTVFTSPPELIRITKNTGATFIDDWVVKATTVDGRELVFDVATGKLR